MSKKPKKNDASQLTVFGFLFWCFSPYLLCRVLYLFGEIPTRAEADRAGLVGSAACLLLNLFLLAKGSYRLVWKRSKKTDAEELTEAASPVKSAADIAREAAAKAASSSGGKIRWKEDEPDLLTVKDPATGAESGYKLNPETGEWTGIETGSILDPNALPEWLEERSDDRSWINIQNTKLKTGDNAQDRTLSDIRKQGELEQRKLDEESRRIREIWEKYHTLDDSPKHLKEIIARDQRLNEIEAGRGIRKGNLIAVLEGGTGWIQTGANYGIDFLGEVTGPGGKHIIKNGYIVARNFSGRLSEAVVRGGDMGKAAKHALADSAVDILQSELSGASLGTRFAVNAGGDSYKAVLQAIEDGEDPVEAGAVAFFSGSVGTGLDSCLDKGIGLVKKNYITNGTKKLVNLNREFMKGNLKQSVWKGTSQVIGKQMQQGADLIETLGGSVVKDVVKDTNTKINDTLFNTHQKVIK